MMRHMYTKIVYAMKQKMLCCKWLLLCLVCLIATSCQQKPAETQYVIAVSLDNSDQWHDKMRDEILQEAALHPQLRLAMKNARNSMQLQCLQIDSLIQLSPDLLIVCVGDPTTIQSVTDRAFDAGIPIVINSRNPKMDKYTAFVGNDNIAVGYLMAEYLLNLSKKEKRDSRHPLRVVELLGRIGDPAVSERYVGLRDSIKGHNEIEIVSSVCGEWYYDKSYALVDSILHAVPDIDVIVAQNDVMALGAYAAGQDICPDKNFHILGVDALSGEGNGVEAIIEGKIAASITNASCGDMLVKTANSILNGDPYLRDNYLQPMLVDHSSTKLMMRMSQEMNYETKVIRTLQVKVDQFFNQTSSLKNQNLILAFGLTIFLILVVILGVIYHIKIKANRERAQNAMLMATQQQQLEKITAELERVKSSQSMDEQFLARLQDEFEKHLDDCDYSVDQLSETMGVSRAQLFRRVRALTGVTPLAMLKQIRLRKARQLLQYTDMNIQQVAYSVGYSLPAYFAKNYKEMFGILPSEEERRKSHK